MAERIVSPGVFTREKDLTFLPQGISDIGAALIGPTETGPAFVPTIVRNMGEFETIFGKENQDFYVPFTAKQYLRSAGTVTIVRVLGLGGYANDTITLGISGSFGHKVAAVLKPSRGATDPDATELAGPTSASIVMGIPSSSAFQLALDQIIMVVKQHTHYHLIQVQLITLQKYLVKTHKTQTTKFMYIPTSKTHKMQQAQMT